MGGVRSIAVVAGAIALMLLPAPATGANTTDRACAWVLEPTYDRENILFPEVTTRYLGAIVPAPPGGYVEISGEYPHARYMSLQTYSSTLQTTSVLRDTAIEPDKGSRNPFVRGADRRSGKRSYTVRLVSGRQPASPAPNTLYNTSADGKLSGNGLAYRIYLADDNSGRFGGVAPPDLALVTANGTRIPIPSCPDIVPDTSGLSDAFTEVGLDGVPLPPVGVLGKRNPVFHRYVNAPTSYGLIATENELFPDALERAVAGVTLLLPAGLGENADNKYVAAYLSQEFGKIAVVSAKMPNTPKTLAGQKRMGGGQMRFWSMCTGFLATQTHDCATDENVAVDKHDRFQIVMSTNQSRPADATDKCGFTWLSWGPSPKHIAIMRNMLPAKRFKHAVQDAKLDHEQETMGAYYPHVRYFATPEAFEQKYGC
ncbi:MAG: hypothetical protein QOG62_243 [Thermoleophilaceae bacterium]|nr:hypothetical protein [Thermoleophilaceae bacterium]